MTKKIPNVRAPRRPTVLLLEDDAACRYSMPLLWNSQNIGVVVTDDGNEALLMCQDRNNQIAAAVVDVFMSKMRGDEFAERLALVRPDLPVIFISGLPEEELIARGILTGSELFFGKPIVTNALVEKLAELLGIELPKSRKRVDRASEARVCEPLTINEFTVDSQQNDL